MNESSRRMPAVEPFALPNSGDWSDSAVLFEDIHRKPLDEPRSRVELVRLLGVTALIWLAIGVLLWWRGASALSRMEALADFLDLKTSSAREPSQAVALARIEPKAPQPPVQMPEPVVPWTVELAAEESSEWEDPSDDDSPEAVTAVRDSHEGPAPARLAVARPPKLSPVAVGGAALARPPPDPADPWNSVMARLAPRAARHNATIVRAKNRRAPSRVARSIAGALFLAPMQTTGLQAADSQVSGGPRLSYGLNSGGTSPRGPPPGALRLVSTSEQPPAVAPTPKLNRLPTKAWDVVDRGDHQSIPLRLLQARKPTRQDLRADSSLGLLNGVLPIDRAAAARPSTDCVRLGSPDVPAFTNLTVASMLNRHEAHTTKQWRAIVRQRADTPEVLQSIGHVRNLPKEGRLRVSRSLLNTLDGVCTEAAVATLYIARPQGEFQRVPLDLSGGQSIGWNDLRKMEYTAPPPAPRTGATTPITLARQPNATIGSLAADVSLAMFSWRAIQSNSPDTSLA